MKEILNPVRALNPDPSTYTILNIRDKEMRVKITRAKIENNRFVPEKVIPEGKKEMDWESMPFPMAKGYWEYGKMGNMPAKQSPSYQTGRQ